MPISCAADMSELKPNPTVVAVYDLPPQSSVTTVSKKRTKRHASNTRVTETQRKEHEDWAREYGSLCNMFGHTCDKEVLKWLGTTETVRSPEMKRAITRLTRTTAECKEHETKVEQNNLRRIELARKRSATKLIDCFSNLGTRIQRIHQRRQGKGEDEGDADWDPETPAASEIAKVAKGAEPDKDDPDEVWMEIEQEMSQHEMRAYGASTQAILLVGIPKLMEIADDINFVLYVFLDNADGKLNNDQYLELRHPKFRKGYAVYNFEDTLKPETRLFCVFVVTFNNEKRNFNCKLDICDLSSAQDFQTLIKDFTYKAYTKFVAELDDGNEEDDEDENNSLPVKKKQKTKETLETSPMDTDD